MLLCIYWICGSMSSILYLYFILSAVESIKILVEKERRQGIGGGLSRGNRVTFNFLNYIDPACWE